MSELNICECDKIEQIEKSIEVLSPECQRKLYTRLSRKVMTVSEANQEFEDFLQEIYKE